jgi:hypothetical protein
MKGTVFIPINGAVIKIDVEDYLRILPDRIYSKLSGYGYARTTHPTRRKRPCFVHHIIMGFPVEIIDHVNMDKTDNRRRNLRLSNKSLNNLNSGPQKGRVFKGVCIRNGRIEGYIVKDKKQYYLGKFDNHEDAARMYNVFIIKSLGYDYYLNKTGDDYSFFTPIPRFEKLQTIPRRN